MMVRENPISIILIFLVVVVAAVGQMAKEKSDLTEKSGAKTEALSNSNSCAIPTLVLVVLVVLGRLFWRLGQPWKKR